jgi:hypothetical protein
MAISVVVVLGAAAGSRYPVIRPSSAPQWGRITPAGGIAELTFFA